MQDSLFESPQNETENKLAGVLDSLESKFGETAVMSGALWQRFHGENGTRRKRSELKAAVDAQSSTDVKAAYSADIDAAHSTKHMQSNLENAHFDENE